MLKSVIRQASNAPWLLAMAVAGLCLIVYAFEMFDFMAHSWNHALYDNLSIPDCTADVFGPSCYAAFKHRYLGNLSIAEDCLIGLCAEGLVIRFWRKKPLVAIFGRRLTLIFFIVSTLILCVHSTARMAVAAMAAPSNSTDGIGIFIGLYILTIPALGALQCAMLGAANFPTPNAHGREIKLSAPRLIFLAATALIPILHVVMTFPVDDCGFLPWGVLTWSVATGMLREAAARG